MNGVVTCIVMVSLLVAAVWLSFQTMSCRHVDEDGLSLLAWTYRDGAIRGWCQQCYQVTDGWPSASPQFTRFPSARVVTPLSRAGAK